MDGLIFTGFTVYSFSHKKHARGIKIQKTANPQLSHPRVIV